MDGRIYIMFVLAVLELGLGVYALARNPHSKIIKAFSVMVAGVVLWVGFNAIIGIAENTETIFNLYKVTYLAGVIIALGVYFFAYYFPYQRSEPRTKTSLVVVGLAVILGAGTLFSKQVIDGVIDYSGYFDISAGPIYGLYVVFFIGLFANAIWKLAQKFRESDGIHREQIKFILVSLSIPVVISFFTELILPWMEYDRGGWLYYVGSLSSSIWLFICAYILFRR